MNECSICTKHRRPSDYIGTVIAEIGGFCLTHFPFLPDEKATRGRLIVEPLRHITDLSEMNSSEASALGPLFSLGTTLLKSELGAEHVYVFRINDKVAHLHFHLVPRYPGTPREYWGLKILEWPEPQALSLAEIQKLAESLKSAADR